MTPRIFTLGAAMLSLLAFSHETRAAGDIPGGPSTKAKLPISAKETKGDWSAAGDSDWYRVALKKGVAYGFGLNETGDGGFYRIVLRDPTGKVLEQGVGDTDASGGFEYVAPKDGVYFLEAKLEDFDFGGGADGSYAIVAGPDCLRDARTTCNLKIGTTQQRAILSADDVDWLRVQLAAGRSYDFTGVNINSGVPQLGLDLVDAAGKILVRASRSDGSPDQTLRIKGFKPPAAGVYYLELQDRVREGGGRYRISAKLAGP